MQATRTYLKFIPLENLNLWDVKRYYTKSNMQFENVVTLRDILIPYKYAISKEEMIENKWQIISKINFGGELFLRDFEEIETYKGSLNLVPDNTIIYSKINVRHGCIYFHEGGKTPSKARNDFWNGTIYWTSPKDFAGQMFIQSAEDTITELAVSESGIKVFPKGVLLSVFRSGILQHSFPTAITEIETAINQDLKAYSLNESLIDKNTNSTID